MEQHHEVLPRAAFTAIGLAAAGMALAGCGHTEAANKTPDIAGHAEAYQCTAHMYTHGDVSVVVNDDNKPGRHVEVDAIRITLPNKPAARKPAEHNQAEFRIPRSYTQIAVQAAIGHRLVACTTLYKRP